MHILLRLISQNRWLTSYRCGGEEGAYIEEHHQYPSSLVSELHLQNLYNSAAELAYLLDSVLWILIRVLKLDVSALRRKTTGDVSPSGGIK